MKQIIAIIWAIWMFGPLTVQALEKDAYEDDNTEETARTISYLQQPVDVFQVEEQHTIHDENDQDWFRFYVWKNHFDEKGFDIYIKNVSDKAAVFTFSSSDGGYQSSRQSYVFSDFKPQESGYYTLKVSADRPVSYTIVIGAADGGGWVRLAGEVTDAANGQLISEGLTLTDIISGNRSPILTEGGKYITLIQAGEHQILASAPGYEDKAVIVNVSQVDRISGIYYQDIQLSASNRTPVASFSYRISETIIGYRVSLDASASSDEDGSIVSYLWETSSGQSSSGERASISFSSAGQYQISLTVVDNQGAENRLTQTIIVGEQAGENNDSSENETLVDEAVLSELQQTQAITSGVLDLSLNQNGNLQVAFGQQLFVFRPQQLQENSSNPAGITLDSNGRVIFSTDNYVLSTTAVLAAAEAMEQLLSAASLQMLENDNYGGLAVLPVSQTLNGQGVSWFSLRPAFASLQSELASETLVTVANGSTGSFFAQVFALEGQFYQQIVYPHPASWEALQQLLQAEPGSSAILGIDGTIQVTMADGSRQNFICDYRVSNLGDNADTARLQAVADQNGDGVADYEIHYADGKTQVLYLVP